MAKLRVFISSVVEGFQTHRDAARRGIEHAGADAVLVNEDFPADARSPRNACLDAVASSDAYVLIVGGRGGWVTPSGKLVVEEEYDQARARRMPILVFLQTTPRDASAEALAARLSDYVDGQFREIFDTTEELESAVFKAVSALARPSRMKTMVDDMIKRRLSTRARINNDAAIRVVIAPERHEEIVSPVDMMSRAFVRRLYEFGHGGQHPIFDYSQPKQERVVDDALTIHQQDPHGRHDSVDEVWLSLDEHGVIEIEANITSRDGSRGSPFSAGMVVAIPDVEDRLRSAFAFVQAVYNWRDPFKRHHQFQFNVAIHSLGLRRFTRDTTPKTSYTMSLGRTDGPLIVYPTARPIGRDNIADPIDEIARIIAVLERSERG